MKKHKIRSQIALLVLGVLLSSCTNNQLGKKLGVSASNGINNLINNYNHYTISGVSVAGSSGGSTTSSYTTTIQFSTAISGTSGSVNMTSDCSASTCLCKYSWSELNTNTNPSTVVPRVVYTPVSAVQTAALSCPAPASTVWEGEIPTNTAVSITVIPNTGNAKQFTVSTYSYSKGQNTSTGNFSDNQGNSFYNILRYSCYMQRKKGLTVVSRMGVDAASTFTYPIANKFCFYDSEGNPSKTDGNSNCSNLSSSSFDYTAQANYFNLYIRSSEVGDINSGNSSFICPTVTEGLNSGTSGGTQGKYWPLDSSFALALAKSSHFNVGVVANSKTSNVGDPTAQNSTCGGSTSSSSGSSSGANSLIYSCLGFAATPNDDGTCPSYSMTNGTTMKTYRLRRYVALYPSAYEASGLPFGVKNNSKSMADAEPQQVDTIYVVDRPVSSGTSTEYTMMGPKPCPYSYFDSKGVTSATASYVSTSNASWDGKNVDGTQFPITDTANSCTALLPLPNASGTAITMGTISAPRYIRPVSHWTPHYEEDTSFKACAPLSSPVQDPPLHFSKTASGNVAWCAEVYPTQNNNVAKLDPTNAGAVKNYTSHVSKYTTVGACSASTTLTYPSGYPASGLAKHPSSVQCDASSTAFNCTQTCDRTVVNPTSGISWPRFPLLAPAADIETAITADSSYSCLMTYDNSGASNSGVTKVGSATPSQGCCGTAAYVWTGSASAPYNQTTAHLEPPASGSLSTETNCAQPSY